MEFDLVSDLHCLPGDGSLTWKDWDPASICVVAGDLVRGRTDLAAALRELRETYDRVIYVDGNSEHRDRLGSISVNCGEIRDIVEQVHGAVYLYDNMVLIDDVAFLGTNGWYSFDADSRWSFSETAGMIRDHYGIDQSVCDNMLLQSIVDSRYLMSSLRRLQRYPDIRRIVIVTHTVPHRSLIRDPGVRDHCRVNATVNTVMAQCLQEDTEHKVRAWCFGHLHEAVDQVLDQVRYVSNPRGRPGSPWFQESYRPLRITV